MHNIITAIVAQPCIPANVARQIGRAVAAGFSNAPAAVFAGLAAQGVTPQLLCFGNGFGIAYETAPPLERPAIANAFTNAVTEATSQGNAAVVAAAVPKTSATAIYRGSAQPAPAAELPPAAEPLGVVSAPPPAGSLTASTPGFAGP